jgi:GNAT superfamily N-acetyltransferase
VRGDFSPLEPLTVDNHIGEFDSGEPELDEWLVRRAWRNQLAGFSRSYVTSDDTRVVGYHSISAFSVLRSDATGRSRRQGPTQIPAILLGRLAVDQRAQGRGLGTGLLRHAMELTVAASETIGVRMLVVSALNPAAAEFYEKFGLTRSPTSPLDLMITVADVETSMPA